MSQTESKNKMKFCIDCKWCKPKKHLRKEFSDCYHPKIYICNIISGEVQGMWCDSARGHNGKCGKEAKLFEPKESIIARIFSFFRKDKS